MSYIWEPNELWMDKFVFLFIQILVNYKKETYASKPIRDSSMMRLGS